MKRLFLILLAATALALVSCEKLSSGKVASYTFTENTDGYNLFVSESPSGTKVDYTYFINEYNENGLKVAMNVVDKPIMGKAYMFNASEDASYVTVKWQYSLTLGTKEISNIRFMSNAFVLKKGETTSIVVNKNTYFQGTEPK